jgi:hypothetical protein
MSQSQARLHVLPALATALLLGVSLSAAPAIAKEKTKPGKSAPAMEVSYSVSIPTIESTAANMTDETLADILEGNLAEHAQALASLDAHSIVVPEIVLTVSSQQAGKARETTITFSDLVLEGVDNGVAERVSLGGVAMISDEAQAEFGAMGAANFDIGGVLGIYGLADRGGQTDLQTIYTDFSAEGGSLSSDELDCTIGATAGAEFKARPLTTSFGEILALAQTIEDEPEDIDPAQLGQLLRIYADMLTAFETSEVTFDGISCTGEDNEGRPMVFEVAGMTMGGMSPGHYPAISMNGFSIVVEGDGFMSLDNLTFKAMDLSDAIAVLQSAPLNVTEAWLEENARAMFPAMEGFAFSGFNIDIPEPDNPDARIKAGIGAFDLSLGSYRNAIPTDLDVQASNIRIELPENVGDDALEQLRALGVTSLDAGFRLAAAWDERTNQINLEELSVTGVDLATVTLAGTIANAGADLFSLDLDAVAEAALVTAVKSLDLAIVDTGLSDLALAIAAKEQGSSPEQMRPILAGLAQGTIIGVLADAANAAQLGEVVNRFISGTARTLNIGIIAKTDPGLGFEDMMEAEQNPASLIGKVNITATAE